MRKEQLKKFKELSKLVKKANIPIITATQIAPVDNQQIRRIRSTEETSNGVLFIDYIDIIGAK